MSRFPLPRAAACAMLAAAPLFLSACASSDVIAMKPATQADLGRVKVTEVGVTLEMPKPNPKLEAAMHRELLKTVGQCTSGSAPHRMEVAIVDFDDQNTVQTIMIGDEIQVSGKVRLIDSATGVETGSYFVENSFFWGGMLGAAMMANAEGRLSKDFAENLCKELFSAEVKTSEARPEAAPQLASAPRDTGPCGGGRYDPAQSEPYRPWAELRCK